MEGGYTLTAMTHYSDGYARGYTAVQLEAAGISSSDLALDDVAKQRAAEAARQITDEQFVRLLARLLPRARLRPT